MALKLSIENAIKKSKSKINNKTGYQKYVQIELPFSMQAFQKFFIRKFERNISNTQNQKHMELSVNDLDSVFGKDWHIIENATSTTIQRILGMVSVNFRAKMRNETSTHRYLNP